MTVADSAADFEGLAALIYDGVNETPAHVPHADGYSTRVGKKRAAYSLLVRARPWRHVMVISNWMIL
jgi:hypothetical protein